MRTADWIAVGVMVTALSIGTMLDDLPEQNAGRSGRYYTLAADFHVHSFFGDGALSPWELRREARRRGLDVIVISNHNQIVGARLGSWLARDGRLPLVLVAQEITTPRFHAIGVGLSETIDWRLPPGELLARVHRQGGVVIAAHPTASSWRIEDSDVLRALDGAEVAHPAESTGNSRAELHRFFERTRQLNARLAAIGSSDFHFVAPLGECRTYVLTETVTASGVLDAIRAGRTVAQDGRGDLIGDEAHVALVRRHLAAAAPIIPPGNAARLIAIALLIALGFLVVRH